MSRFLNEQFGGKTIKKNMKKTERKFQEIFPYVSSSFCNILVVFEKNFL